MISGHAAESLWRRLPNMPDLAERVLAGAVSAAQGGEGGSQGGGGGSEDGEGGSEDGQGGSQDGEGGSEGGSKGEGGEVEGSQTGAAITAEVLSEGGGEGGVARAHRRHPPLLDPSGTSDGPFHHPQSPAPPPLQSEPQRLADAAWEASTGRGASGGAAAGVHGNGCGGGVAVGSAEEREALDALLRREPWPPAGSAAAAGPAGWGDCLEAETVVTVEAGCGGRGNPLHHRLFVHTTPASMHLATVVVPED